MRGRGRIVAALALLAGCAETVARTQGRDVVEVVARDDADDAGDDGDVARDDASREDGDGAIDASDARDAEDAAAALDGGDGALDATRDVVDTDGPDPRVCERAPTIGAGTIQGFFAGATQRVATCNTASGSLLPALFGRITVPARHLLRAVVSSLHSVSLFEGCDTARCLPARYSLNAAEFINARDEARTLTLAIAGAFLSSPIPTSLRVELVPLRPEDLCALAPEIASDATVRLDPGPAVDTRPRCDSSEVLATSFVRVRVRAGERVVAQASDAVLRFFGDCEARACLPGPRAAWAAWTNDDASERTVVLAVSAGSAGPRPVALSFGPPPPTSRCATAPPIPDGVRTLDRTAAGVDLFCGGRPIAHWYRATVPPGRRLTVVGEGDVNAPVVYLQDGCEGSRCFLEADQWRGGRSNTSIWDNVTAQTRELRIATIGVLTLSATVAPIPATARCDTAPLLTPGPALRGAYLPDRAEVTSRCEATSMRGRIYRVRVPPLSRLDVELRPPNSDAHVALMSGCGSGTCLASGAGTFPGRSSFRWINAERVERELFLMLGLRESVAPVAVSADLDIAFEAPLGHARCSGALPVRAGDVVTDPREIDVRELASLCDDTNAVASALFYAIDVPAGRRLVVTAQLGGVVQGRIAVLDACAGRCLAGNASTYGTLSWRNDGAARRVTVAFFGAPFFLRTGPYALTFTVE